MEYKEEELRFSTIALSKKYIYKLQLKKDYYSNNNNPKISITYKKCDVINNNNLARNTDEFEFIFENEEVADAAFNEIIDEYNSSDENKIINLKNIVNNVKIRYNEKYKNEVFYKSIN